MTQVNNVKTLDQQFTDETGIDVSKKVRGVNLEPVVGMGVTRSIGSDSYPYTIINILTVKNKTILKIQQDHTLYIKKQDGRRARDIEYLEQYRNHGLDGRIEYRDIKWNEQTKRWNKGCSYYYASVGKRHYDLDPSF
jgi:hypothetical protein